MAGIADIYSNISAAQKEALEAMGVKSAAEGGLLFCATVSEPFAINGVTYQWPRNSKLKWNLGFTSLGSLNDMDLKGVYEGCFKEIMAACQVDFEYTANPDAANILVNLANMDGPSGVLADMQIPVGSIQQVLGRIDKQDSWVIAESPPGNMLDIYRVALHELLHAMGLGHAPVIRDNPALIEPTYNRNIRHLQPRDIAELVRRYGSRIGSPQTPSGRIESCIAEIKIKLSNGQSISFTGEKPFPN